MKNPFGKNIPFLIMMLGWQGCQKETLEEKCGLQGNIGYQSHIQNIIRENCFECHAPDVYKKKASRNKIFSYENLRAFGETGVLLGSLNHEKGYIAMPHKKGYKIDSCAIEAVEKWVSGGFPR